MDDDKNDDLAVVPENYLNLAVAWLKLAGAEGVWLLRGAKEASLGYVFNEDAPDPLELHLAAPHELIVIARFPVGDGGLAGIEFK